MGEIACFLVEPIGQTARSLRRFVASDASKCSAGPYHNAQVPLDRVPADPMGEVAHRAVMAHEVVPQGDPRWPTQCACGYVFSHFDEWQIFPETLFRRVDTGEVMTIAQAPAGAMWFADWMNEGRVWGGDQDRWMRGPDGRCLVVKTPGGEWLVDSRASNCTMPEDKAHKCWVRHGTAPLITVDKNGLTCGAGGGSIQTKGFHAMLTGGVLREC